MLLLIVAHGHVRGLVGQDVGRHERRIGEQPNRSVFPVLARFFLELRHTVQPTHPRDAIEDPSQFGVLDHGALREHGGTLRINAGGDEGRGGFARIAGQIFRVELGGDGVHIDHAIEAVVIVLERDEVLKRAEIIAQMQAIGRLHAGKDAFRACI